MSTATAYPLPNSWVRQMATGGRATCGDGGELVGEPCLAVSQAGREALGDERGLWTVLHGVGHQSEAERPEYEPSDAVSSIAKYAKPQKPMTFTPVM